jgi:hypothetical protein
MLVRPQKRIKMKRKVYLIHRTMRFLNKKLAD